MKELNHITTPAPHVSHNSGNNEWYTPPEFIECAKAVMGNIDLDPASSNIANRTVGAKVYFTKEDNGLEQEWSGRVWMNPPYARHYISKFIDKLICSHNVSEFIVLINNATETLWFQRIIKKADCVCFPKGRIRFLDENGNPGAPLQGQAVIYAGPNCSLFISEFSRLGFVCKIAK